jgi:hypothetical protein
MEITKRILLASALALCGVFTNYAYAEPRSVNLQTSNVQEPTGETYKSSAQVRAPLSPQALLPMAVQQTIAIRHSKEH